MTEFPTYILDHDLRALAELASQFDNATNLRALVLAYSQEMQNIEDATWSMLRQRLLAEAVGAQLDQWGKIVGEDRGGLPDETYRKQIQARLLTNRSHGTPDELTAILRILTGSGPVRYSPVYPAAMRFQYVVEQFSNTNKRRRVVGQMLEAAPAGVEIKTIVEAESSYFGFADDPNAAGFGVGVWAEDIYQD